MYSINSTHRNALDSGARGRFIASVEIGTISSTDVQQLEFKSGSSSGGSINIGACISTCVNFELKISNMSIDSELKIYISMYVNNVEEKVPMGIFNIMEVKEENGIWTGTAYDNLIRANEPYNPRITFPTTLQAMCQDAAEIAGVTFTTETIFPNITISSPPSNKSCADIFAIAAQFMGCNVFADRYGRICFKWYSNGISIDNTQYYNYEKGKMTSFSSISCDTGKAILTSGSGQGISITNEYMTQTLLNQLLLNTQTSYLPAKCDFIGDMTVDPWDIITVDNDSLYIMSYQLQYDGGLISSVEVFGETSAGANVYQGRLSKKIAAVEKGLDSYKIYVAENYIDGTTLEASLALKIEDKVATLSAYANEIKFNSDTFSVSSTNLSISKAGVLTAKGATITGKITATSGKIGAFNLTSDGAFYSGSSTRGGTGTYMGTKGISCSNTDASCTVEMYDSVLKLTQNGTISDDKDMPRIIFKGAYGVPNATDVLRYSGKNSLFWSGGFQTLEDIIAGGGLSVAKDATITGKIWAPCIELSANSPYIDFHYASSTKDYTSRIIETAAGTLQVQVDALKISSVTSGECPIVRSSSGVMQFSSGSDSYVNYISGSEVRVCNLARTTYKVIKASAFTVSSSRRLKDNIQDMTEDEANKIYALNVVTFDYKNGESNQRGLIAEDTYRIIPSMVQGDIFASDEDEDAIMGIGIDYSKAVPYLIKLVQMLKQELEEMKGEQ